MSFFFFVAAYDLLKFEGIATDQSVYGILISGAARERQFSYLIQLVKVCLNYPAQLAVFDV